MSDEPNLEQQLLSEQYRVAPDVFWQLSQMRGDDGYDRMEAARGRGWQAVPSWGVDGWDLGAWPLVVISHRRTAESFELAYDVEGDITAGTGPARRSDGRPCTRQPRDGA